MLPGLTAEEARNLVLSIGTHHSQRRLSPVEVAELFNKAILAGASTMECARFVNLTGPSMISRFLRLMKLSPEIRHLVDWGQTGATMSFETAWRLADLNKDEQEAAATPAMANQMSKDEVNQVLQIKKRSRRHVLECINEVLGMRANVVKKYVFIGAVIGDALKQYLVQLRQIQRDELLIGILIDHYGDLPNVSARLGLERFTIVTNEEGATRLNEGKQADFETIINKSLSAKAVKI